MYKITKPKEIRQITEQRLDLQPLCSEVVTFAVFLVPVLVSKSIVVWYLGLHHRSLFIFHNLILQAIAKLARGLHLLGLKAFRVQNFN